MKNFMRSSCVILGCLLAVACGTTGSGGIDGTNGTDGTNGSPGVNGSNGDPGSAGTAGTAGSNGLNGEAGSPGQQGEVGPSGDAGVSLCGDQQMPEWHTACGQALVGACATTNARWECHARLTGDTGNIEEFKVCADATTHVPVSVSAAQSSSFPNSPVAQSSNRCDQDADCDSVLDLLVDTVSNGDSNSVQVSVGTVVSYSGGSPSGASCLSGTAACDTTCGRIKVVFAAVTGSDTLGADCFNPTTTLEGSMGCGLNGTWISPDYDSDPIDWCETEGTLVLGQAAVSCVGAAHDTQACLSP